VLESIFTQKVRNFEVDSLSLLTVKRLPKATSLSDAIQKIEPKVIDQILQQFIHKIVEQIHFVFALKGKELIHLLLHLL
jgi:hypothetical protein